MIEEELLENKKRKIAFEIIYYSKRIFFCVIFVFIYYGFIFPEYFFKYANKVYYDSWILSDFISYYDFINLLFHSFLIISIILILFNRQIAYSYNWLKKYSK
ncbi:hypothetical protein FLGE108171_15535 [Flavobacterium gelidilacus]|jgi:hypothetical protein